MATKTRGAIRQRGDGVSDLPLFADPFTRRILPEDEYPERYYVDQVVYFDGTTIWNRVTPGLIRWMRDKIEQARAGSGVDQAALDRSEEFLLRISFESGLEAGDVATEPFRKPGLIAFYQFKQSG
jgi:hypothetical protein